MGREDVLDDGNDSLNYTDYERRLVRTCVSQVNFGKPKKPSLLGLQLPQGCELIRRAVWTGHDVIPSLGEIHTNYRRVGP